ncbi:splicing factor U2AF U2 snRNP auxiliary factor large subunit [Cryptosporidium xiaoi]|uniref:Splicing factor U2AF U2 snRNP auxiliary factor large subunit n=1 Tax=Cryptosporidium xiaoi TaxID=659607 RepID=A0AAV9XU66_9CRYT
MLGEVIDNRNSCTSYKNNSFKKFEDLVELSKDSSLIRSQNRENAENSNSERSNFNINLGETFYKDLNNVNPGTSSSKTSREVYVGNLPSGINVAQLLEFINLSVSDNYDYTSLGNPVISAWINPDGKYAFCECRSIDIASNLLGLNNTLNLNGHFLKIGKPKISGISNISEIKSSSSISTNQLSQHLGIISPYFGNIPLMVSKKEIFLITKISNFYNIYSLRKSVKGRININILDLINYKEKYKIAICEVETSDVHSLERLFEVFGEKINILNLRDISENNKIIKFINTTLLNQIKNIQLNELHVDSTDSKEYLGIYSSLIIPNYPSRCIVLSKLLTFEEITTDNIGLITTDIKNECSKFGEIVNFEIPKPKKISQNIGKSDLQIGSVFILYNTVEDAINAKLNLFKMRFLGRNIRVKYLPESEFPNFTS